MPDSPKPTGTTVTHERAKAIIDLLCAHGGEHNPDLVERLTLAAYVSQQEAAEREHGTDYKMMFEVAEEKLNEYIDKTVEAERDARKNFESYERIRDKYSAEVNEHRESNARVGVLEARLEEAEKRAETADKKLAERQARAADDLDFPLTVECMRDKLCEVLQTSFHSPLCTPELLDKVLKRLEVAELDVAVFKRVCSGCGATNAACNRLADPCCEKCPHVAPQE